MPTWLTVLLTTAAVLAIYSTTASGQRLISRLGFDSLDRSGPPREDREYLLGVCGGDMTEVQRRLDAEHRRNANLSEAEIYRKAIRRYMNNRPEEPESSE